MVVGLNSRSKSTEVLDGSVSAATTNKILVVSFTVKSVLDPPSWHQPDSPLMNRVLRGMTSSPVGSRSSPFYQQGYVSM